MSHTQGEASGDNSQTATTTTTDHIDNIYV